MGVDCLSRQGIGTLVCLDRWLWAPEAPVPPMKSSKSTESPRRLSSILLPAHALLHRSSSSSTKSPLAIPSPTYDTLRATLVQAELILLRVLAFELRLPSPLEYLQRYLERAMEDVENVGEAFDEWDRDAKDEYGVQSGIIEGRLGSKCKQRAVDA
ncbi:MAG: hypothetical protein Q9178_005403 [Gyalolechia marmorata]